MSNKSHLHTIQSNTNKLLHRPSGIWKTQKLVYKIGHTVFKWWGCTVTVSRGGRRLHSLPFGAGCTCPSRRCSPFVRTLWGLRSRRRRGWWYRIQGNESFWGSIPSACWNETHSCSCLCNTVSSADLIVKKPEAGWTERDHSPRVGRPFSPPSLLPKKMRARFLLPWKQHHPFEAAKRLVSPSLSCPSCLVLRCVCFTFPLDVT